MLKNSTKITSLLVAAASMATMVPAMAADKIADKDGKIYRAVAYADGKFYVDGDDIENAGDKDGVYWLNGGKHSEVDSDVDSGDAITRVYGEKYVEIEEGDAYVDLSTGKVVDDQLVTDEREDAASELAKKVRKDDPGRYFESTRDDKAEVRYNKNTDGPDNEIWEVPGANYMKPYYQVNYLKFDGDKGKNVVKIVRDVNGENPTLETGVADADGTPSSDVKPTVYTDEKGKYIDADNDLGTVNVIINKNAGAATTAAGAFIVDPDSNVNRAETLKFEEVGDKKTKDKDFRVDLKIEHIATLAQDKDNVYRLAALHVYYGWEKGSDKDAAGNYKVTDVAYIDGDYRMAKIKPDEYVTFGSTKNPTVVQASEYGRFYVIQKISKEQDGDKDDAKLPKSTETYLATEKKDWKKKGEMNYYTTDDAAFLTKTEKDGKANKDGKTNEKLGYIAYSQKVEDGVTKYTFIKPEETVKTNDGDRDVLAGSGDKDEFVGLTRGCPEAFEESFENRYENNVAYTVADGKVTKYQTEYETLNDNGSADDNDDEKFYVRTFSLKQSNGLYYVDESHNDDDFDDEEEFATTVDKDGNIWKLDSGKIYKYKNDGDYELVYKCDGGLNELSVYDDKNLIAYNEDDDVYAIVGGKSSTGKYEVEDENKTTTTTTAQVGWYTNADGSWSYGNADGTKAIGWLQSPTSGLWYYMDANGIMMSNGWVQDGAYWYFLGADGAMKTGWVYTNGAWYYLKETAGNKGAMQTGWIQTGGKWYYCNASGAMLSNTTVNGYKLGADGAWIK